MSLIIVLALIVTVAYLKDSFGSSNASDSDSDVE